MSDEVGATDTNADLECLLHGVPNAVHLDCMLPNRLGSNP